MSTPNDTSPTKQCNKCGEWFPATPEYWHKRKPSPDGLSYTCKQCAIARTKKHYAEDLEYARQQKREYYHTHKAERRAYNQRTLERRRERRQRPDYKAKAAEYRKRKQRDLVKYNQGYRASHPDWQAGVMREWRRRNPERAKAIIHRRIAMKHLAPGQFTAEDVRRQHDEQEGRCFYCGIALFDDYHVDHKVPLSRGGSNGPENIACACEPCNLGKGAKTEAEWQTVRGW